MLAKNVSVRETLGVYLGEFGEFSEVCEFCEVDEFGEIGEVSKVSMFNTVKNVSKCFEVSKFIKCISIVFSSNCSFGVVDCKQNKLAE